MNNEGTRNDWLVSIGLYVAWLVTSMGAIFDALYIRQGVLAILGALQVIQQDAYQKAGGLGIDFQVGYTIEALNNFLLLILGCAVIAFVIAIEYYFRKGKPKGLLWKRIVRVVVIEVGILVAMFLVLLIA